MSAELFQKPTSILIVEDDNNFRRIVARMCRSKNIQVYDTGSVTGAMSILKDHTPSHALIDLMLPGEDGEVVARWLVQYRPNTKVIILSAVADTDRLASMHSLKNVDVFQKPIDYMVLCGALHI